MTAKPFLYTAIALSIVAIAIFYFAPHNTMTLAIAATLSGGAFVSTLSYLFNKRD